MQVRNTAAWAIGRICQHHVASIGPEQWQKMMTPLAVGGEEGVLLAGLKDTPRVAAKVCWALNNLAEHSEAQKNDATNSISPFLVDLANALLACSQRADAGARLPQGGRRTGMR